MDQNGMAAEGQMVENPLSEKEKRNYQDCSAENNKIKKIYFGERKGNGGDNC
jgi:hypothetical protein